MKTKVFQELADFSRGKSFRKASESDKTKFHALATKCLNEIRKQLKHETNFLRTKYYSFGSEGVTILTTNRVFIEITKPNKIQNEITYGPAGWSKNYFISLDRIAENPKIFVDKLRIMCFCG